MIIYKIIKQTSINDGNMEMKERYVLIQTYTTFIERVVAFLMVESLNPFMDYSSNIFDTLEEARKWKNKLENPTTYTHKEEIVE